MCHYPTVSVITPCYNGERFLRATIESVVAQTVQPLEMIVVDDGSTDNSASIAESFGSFVRVIRQTNQGESVARNRGITEAQGDYLYFLDADDLIHAQSLQRLSDAVAHASGSFALMGCARFYTTPEQAYETIVPTYDEFFPSVINTNLGPIHTWFCPRTLVNQAGMFTNSLQWSEDWDLLGRIALIGAKLISIPFVGAYYRQHSQSQLATTKLANRARGHAAVMQRLGQGMLDRPELLSRYGSEMFWGSWTALHKARGLGVPWSELEALSSVIKRLAAEGPAEIRKSSFGRMIRLLGVRAAETCRNLVTRDKVPAEQTAA